MPNKLIIICTIILGLISCKHQPEIPSSPIISYKNDIAPLIISNCTQSSCHGSGEFSISTYDKLVSKTDIKPGDASHSELYKVIKSYNPTNMMPPRGYTHLNNDQINVVYVWIMQGAKYN